MAQTKEEKNLISKQRYHYMRREIIRRYGGRCECCDESTYEFLCIDHRFGGGNQERKLLSRLQFYTKLYKSQYVLPEYRILCQNCNAALGIYGYCPHYNLDTNVDFELEGDYDY